MSETTHNSSSQNEGGRTLDKEPRRRLAPQAPSHLVRSLCQAVFGAELLAPGNELWMSTRRVWNVPLIDNRANTFRHLEPNWPQGRVRLLAVLEKLMDEGVEVRILTEESRSNQTFAGEFQSIEQGSGNGHLRRTASWSEIQGGVVASSFYLEGGLDLSQKGGLSVARGGLQVYTDDEAIARGRHVFQDQWEE